MLRGRAAVRNMAVPHLRRERGDSAERGRLHAVPEVRQAVPFVVITAQDKVVKEPPERLFAHLASANARDGAALLEMFERYHVLRSCGVGKAEALRIVGEER